MISIHAPPVGSDIGTGIQHLAAGISIHAPPVGSDGKAAVSYIDTFIFQSTLPLWGATNIAPENRRPKTISIHAPPVGSDSKDAQIFGRIFGEVFGFL